jgi:hypothetical protein
VLHREEDNAKTMEWRKNHPDKVKANGQEASRKGGKYYEQHHKHQSTGIPHEKLLVRRKHQRIWTPYKKTIAPGSVLHHEWLPETANFRGVALVEKEQHQHGYIDVIQVLEGEITLLTEAEIKRERYNG